MTTFSSPPLSRIRMSIRSAIYAIAAGGAMFGFTAVGVGQIVWSGVTNTKWGTDSNWFGAPAAVPTASDIAQFQYGTSGNTRATNLTPSVGTSTSVLGLVFNTASNSAYILSSTVGATLTIGTSGIAVSTSHPNATTTISANLVLGAEQTFSNSPTSLAAALTISGSVANGSNLLTVDGTGTGGLISGVIGDGSGGLTKTGTGTWTLQGANSYTGATTVSQGTLTVNGTSGKLGTGDLSVATGSTLNLNNTVTQSVGNLSGAGTINFGAGGTLSIAQASSTTFSGAITGSGATLAKSGGGSLTLSGSSSLANININDGNLIFANTASLPSASAVSLGGGTLQLGTTGTFSTSGALSLTASSTIDFGTLLGATELAFGPSASAWTGTLTIQNYQTSQDAFRVGNSADDIGANWMSIQFILGGVPHLALTGADGLIVPGSAIPEPSTYAAIFGAVALGGAIYRRRRKAALASASAPAAPQAA